MFDTLENGVSAGITMVAGDPEAAGVVGDALRVVAGRSRDDAVRLLFGRQVREEVAGPPFLERAGELKVLELQPDPGAGERRERLRQG